MLWMLGGLLLFPAIGAAQEPASRAERLTTRGEALVRGGDPGSATSYFRRAIQANGRHVPAYAALAGVYLERGRMVDALEVLRVGLHRMPGQPRLTLILARTLHDRGERAAAAALVRELVASEPSNAEAHRIRAELARERGAWSEALDSYRAIEALGRRGEVSSEVAEEARRYAAALRVLVVPPRCEGVVREALCER